MNVNVENVGAGKVSVSFEKNTVVNGNMLNSAQGSMSITAEDGTVFNGNMVADTLVLNGKVTINDPALAGSAKSLPTGNGVTSTEHFAVQDLFFNNGASLTLNGDFDLSNTQITLSQDYLAALSSSSGPVTLISSTPNSNLSGMATLANAPTGYGLTLQDGNLVLASGAVQNTLELAAASLLLTGSELTIITMEVLPGGVNLATLDIIDVNISSDMIRAALNEPMAVTLTIGSYKELTNVMLHIDGEPVGYKGDGAGHYSLVPEPATATLSLLALAGLAMRRRRH